MDWFWIMVAAYFLPTLIAGIRNHHNAGAILALNLLLGWTFIGWAAALVWSFTATTKEIDYGRIRITK